MMEREVYPRLVSADDLPHREHLIVKTWGVPEKELFAENPTLWDQLAHFGSVSSLPQVRGVDIAIELEGTPSERARNKDHILSLLSQTTVQPHIWQVGPLSLEAYVLQQLHKRSETLGFCESCTGGLASHSLTNVPGSSQVFLGSVVCYANEVKTRLLQVPPQTLEDYGVVSQETALAMARGGQKVLGADYCLAYSGLAGPGGEAHHPVGTVAIALATPQGEKSYQFQFSGERSQLKEKFFKTGLFLLLQEL